MQLAQFLIQAIPRVEDEDWLSSAWDAELMTLPDTPDDLDEMTAEHTKLLGIVAHSIRKELDNLAGDQEENEESIYGLWDALQGLEMDYKNMLPVLCFFICNGNNNFENSEMRNIGLQATSCYFLLLAVPGSVTHNMYHSIMLTHALSTLKLAIKISIDKHTSNRAKKRSREMMENEIEEEEDDNQLQLTESQRLELVSQLGVVLFDLLKMLNHFSLKKRFDAMEHIVKQLVELTYLEHFSILKDFTLKQHHSPRNPTTIATAAYIGLQLLCSTQHGDVEDCTTFVMRYILGVLLATQQSLSLNLAPRALNITKENALNFAIHLVHELGKPAWQGVTCLLQQVLTRSSERSETRLRAAQLTMQLLDGLPSNLRNRLCRWLWALGHTDKPAFRLMALEVASQLLYHTQFEHVYEEEPQQSTETENIEKQKSTEEESMNVECSMESAEEGEEPGRVECIELDRRKQKSKKSHRTERFALRHSHLLLLVLYRCDDVAATVRARALTLLSDLAVSLGQERSFACAELLQHVLQGEGHQDKAIPKHEDVLTAMRCEEAPLPRGRVILDVVLTMAHDEHLVVRRAALHALVNIAYLNPRWLQTDVIEVMCLHCRDPLMSVRRQMLQGLTTLLKAHGTTVPDLPVAWLSSVLPALHDPEIRICEFVLELSREIMIDPIRKYGTNNSTNLPWILLRLIPQHDMQNLIISALRNWTKNKLSPSFISTLESHVDTENNAEAWMMLSILAETSTPQDPSFALTHLHGSLINLSQQGTDLAVTRNIMRVLILRASKIDEESKRELQTMLLTKLKSFYLPVELISVAFDLVAATEFAGRPKSALPEARKTISGYCSELLKMTEQILQSLKSLDTIEESQGTERRLLRQICTVGDAVRVGNLNVSKKTIQILHSLLVGHHRNEDHAVELKIKPRSLQMHVSPVLRAITVVALGKLALQNESTAHELLPALGLLLNYDDDIALHNNILCALADLCGRYAVLVDPLVPRMAACLCSENRDLRKQALVLMVQLLQEDYVKLKHGLIFFLLRMLCDPVPELQEMTHFYLAENLLKKQPQALFINLQSALFVFNAHPVTDEDSGAQSARLQPKMAKLLAMSGSAHRESRLRIYRFMLELMNDDHRFQTTHRLCMNILGGFVEDRYVLEGPGKGLLGDTLAVLNCDEIRLHSMHAKPSDENDVLDPDEAVNNAMVTARKAIVTQVVKRNVMVNILPVIRSLKRKLQAAKSPLAEALMYYLRDLIRDFKSEVQEILSGDRQLAAEVAFDIRQLEEQGEPMRHSIAPPSAVIEEPETEHTQSTTTEQSS